METTYKGYVIEYIPHRGDYRVYDPYQPQQTIAYVDSIEEAKQGIDEQLVPKIEYPCDEEIEL